MKDYFTLNLEFDEERIAQLLTRDAWSYFSSPTELAHRSPVHDVPKMPHNGVFALPNDPEMLAYYLTFAGSYYDELHALGWPPRMYVDACEGFVSKVELATGLKRRAPTPHADRLEERRSPI
jgi:hypothetical protein